MQYTVNAHKAHQRLLKRAAQFRAQWQDDVDIGVINAILAHGVYSVYRAKQAVCDSMDSAEDTLKQLTGGRDAWRSFTDGGTHLGDAIRNMRRKRKNRTEYAPVIHALEASKNHADAALGAGFQRSRTKVMKVGKGGTVGLEVEESGHYISNHITVGASWFRSVANRGMSLINAPDGLRFVLRSSPRDVMYVDDDGMNAWQVTVIGFKHGKGFSQDGWVVTHKSTEHDYLHPLVDPESRNTVIPHSFGLTLQKAHSLLKSRTVRHLTKMLDG